jgi:DNA-binding CsgD family transcriptional regulator
LVIRHIFWVGAFVVCNAFLDGPATTCDVSVAMRDDLGLTPRESEILDLVAEGKTNPEIAEVLGIAPTTVRRHLENVYAKLGVHTRTAAVTRCLGFLERRREAIESVLTGLLFLPGFA